MATLGTSAKGVDVVVKSNLKQYKKEWKKLEKHITPNHIGYALGGTVYDLAIILNKNTNYVFDDPTPTTKKAFGYIPPTARQKTIAEKTAWVGLKSERSIPINKAKPKTKAFDSYAGARYRKLMKLQVDGGVRVARYGKDFWTPTKNSRSFNVINRYGGLNYTRLRAMEQDKKKFFVGKPKGYRRSSPNSKGLWKRMGGSGNKNIMKVANLTTYATYNKKYPYNRIVKSNVDRLLRKNFNIQMKKLKKYLKKEKNIKAKKDQIINVILLHLKGVFRFFQTFYL